MNVFVTVIVVLIAVVIGIAVVLGLRTLNAAATSITVHEPEPGVHCALAITTDGVALDCWEVDP